MDNAKLPQQNDTQPAAMTTLAEYAQKDCEKDICAMSTGIQTGFSNLDQYTSIMPGIYVLGAMPALGKTTFAHQLGEQIAASGKPVIYFTFEQKKIDFLLKSLSRESAISNMKEAISAIDLRLGIAEHDTAVSEKFYSLQNEYIAKNLNYYVVECEFGLRISALVSKIEQCIKQLSDLPVVFVDCLQVVGSDNATASQRESVDTIIEQLKRLQQKNNLTLFLISSISRQNYLTALEIDSFKESGKIDDYLEYKKLEKED